MDETTSLRSASVQDIQLELIRRSSFNAFDGPRVVDSLLRHRHLWRAVLLDRLGLPDFDKPRRLPAMGLIKLRDLDGDHWNADMLFVLTPAIEQARELARIAEAEEWVADDVHVHEDRDEIDRALGGSYDPEPGLLAVWWD